MQEMGDLLYSGGDAAVIEMFDSMKTKNAGGFLDYTCIRQQLPHPTPTYLLLESLTGTCHRRRLQA